MTKLSDLDGILLSNAAQRDTGSVFPTPDNLSRTPARLTKAVASLLKRGFIEELETTDKTATHRVDGDVAYGVYLTDAGKAAIVIVDDTAADDGTPPAPPVATPRVTKASTVLALLQREEGATLAELIAATGWLPHTTRAALTGLRKKGHTLEKTKRGDQTCYRATAVAA
jgi:DNA-binding MarR family transcriptional regulator